MGDEREREREGEKGDEEAGGNKVNNGKGGWREGKEGRRRKGRELKNEWWRKMEGRGDEGQ